MNARALWIRTTGVVALAWFCSVPVRAAGDDPLNTAMADPLTLVNAFDRFAAERRVGARSRRDCTSGVYPLEEYYHRVRSDRELPAATTERPVPIPEVHPTS
jgi:hypothetical protein